MDYRAEYLKIKTEVMDEFGYEEADLLFEAIEDDVELEVRNRFEERFGVLYEESLILQQI